MIATEKLVPRPRKIVSRPLAARLTRIEYATLSLYLSRDLLPTPGPIGLMQLLSFAVAGQLRELGIKFDSVRTVARFIVGKTESELERHFATGRRLLVVDFAAGKCDLRADVNPLHRRRKWQQRQHPPAVVINLEDLFRELASAVAAESEAGDAN